MHGYRDAARVRPDIVEAANRLSKEAETLIDAEVHYLRLPVAEVTASELRLDNGIVFSSEIFDRYAPYSSEVIAFLLTTGERLDAQVRQYIDSFELIEALFLESSGWLAVEAVTRLFAADLRATLTGEGKHLGMRLGPGYSYKIEGRTVDWPLEQQRELFKLFEGMDVPVTMLESCAMKPKLSRSGIFSVADRDAAKSR